MSTPTCKECGSTNIVMDSWKKWEGNYHGWQTFMDHDSYFCQDCEATSEGAEDCIVVWKDDVEGEDNEEEAA